MSPESVDNSSFLRDQVLPLLRRVRLSAVVPGWWVRAVIEPWNQSTIERVPFTPQEPEHDASLLIDRIKNTSVVNTEALSTVATMFSIALGQTTLEDRTLGGEPISITAESLAFLKRWPPEVVIRFISAAAEIDIQHEQTLLGNGTLSGSERLEDIAKKRIFERSQLKIDLEALLPPHEK